METSERIFMDFRISMISKGYVPLHFTEIKEIHPFGVDIDERIFMDFRIFMKSKG